MLRFMFLRVSEKLCQKVPGSGGDAHPANFTALVKYAFPEKDEGTPLSYFAGRALWTVKRAFKIYLT